MPVYPFSCEKCKKVWDLKLTMQEQHDTKGLIRCECGEIAQQMVTSLNFRLKGEGWFGRDGGNNCSGLGYEMTQNSMDKSKDEIARMDDCCSEMAAKDENVREI
jgi:predicted nucleic acid-binding Zn ribbon protein